MSSGSDGFPSSVTFDKVVREQTFYFLDERKLRSELRSDEELEFSRLHFQWHKAVFLALVDELVPLPFESYDTASKIFQFLSDVTALIVMMPVKGG